jgi:hypothetical protein
MKIVQNQINSISLNVYPVCPANYQRFRSLSSFILAEIPDETVFLTKPHMYGHNSTGTNVAFTPDFDKHESTIYFEPLSGTPLRAQLRIQLNANAWIDRIRITDDGATEYEYEINFYRTFRFILDQQNLVLFAVLFQ